jgi:hypothetical protein
MQMQLNDLGQVPEMLIKKSGFMVFTALTLALDVSADGAPQVQGSATLLESNWQDLRYGVRI